MREFESDEIDGIVLAGALGLVVVQVLSPTINPCERVYEGICRNSVYVFKSMMWMLIF